MSNSINWANIRKRLESHDQDHLLQWIGELEKEQQHDLHKELSEIDFEKTQRHVHVYNYNLYKLYTLHRGFKNVTFE